MRLSVLLGAAVLVMASPAFASTTFSDNFNSESGGNSALNYGALNNFTVSNGTIDVVKSGDFGITCAGGSGSCIDLDGSTGASGTILSRNSFAFNAGDLVSLSFDWSGNQRNPGSDLANAFFNFAGATAIANYTQGGAFGGVNLGNYVTNAMTSSATLAGSAGWQTYTLGFKALQAGSLRFGFGQPQSSTNANDNMGPMLDNVNLSISSAVPEPATWLMMILGFGLIGGALRRRQQAAGRLTFA